MQKHTCISAVLILGFMQEQQDVCVRPLPWLLFVRMLIWPEWLAEQNNYGYFCLMQHIKSDVVVVVKPALTHCLCFNVKHLVTVSRLF